MGSFDWHVKQEGLRRFLAVADPLFADADCELVIGGRAPDHFRRSLESGLRVTRFVGWVDDPGAFLDACRMGVISESLGGGFKLKALDSMKTTVNTLEGEVAKSKGYIARAEGASQAQASVGGAESPLASLEG